MCVSRFLDLTRRFSWSAVSHLTSPPSKPRSPRSTPDDRPIQMSLGPSQLLSDCYRLHRVQSVRHFYCSGGKPDIKSGGPPVAAICHKSWGSRPEATTRPPSILFSCGLPTVSEVLNRVRSMNPYFSKKGHRPCNRFHVTAR